MNDSAERLRTRGELILLSAIEALAALGVRGASLRDIARDAGTSVTLINHHFGAKGRLVDAAIASLHERAREPAASLRHRLAAVERPGADDIVEAWLDYADHVFGSRTGHLYLRLLMRMRGDPDVEASARLAIDDALTIVRAALRQAFDASDEPAIDSACLVASKAIYGVYANEGMPLSDTEASAHKAFLGRFLVAGLEASLQSEKQRVPA